MFRQTIDDLVAVLNTLDPDQFLLIRTDPESPWHVNTVNAAKRRGYTVHRIGTRFYRIHSNQYQLPFDKDGDGLFDAQLKAAIGEDSE
tara:strand:+ start:9023 stop:9286 length:264 start_codon:yes stop_codon:yes gene_type:complete